MKNQENLIAMQSQTKKIEIKSKTKEEAIQTALLKLGVEEKDIEVNVIQNPSKGFLGLIGAKDGIYEITVIKKEEIEIAKEFIENILIKSKINAKVNAIQEDNLIKISIEGKEATCLIGRRGETLDAVQFLTGLALNKINKDSHMRVLVDIENYRSKREESLVRYARKVAREVAKTRRTKKLDYMNPYERRIVHSALQNDKYVITYSEGTDPYRRLVIEYKR
ncbi:MAG: protein jag [Clostridiales bacterium]|uniref:RNA-binding cell elongation regulator Jag/EloR n=1 Tax=Clostridia TaxID=186801 RepID=UPI002A3AE65D|nr:RNA-binding cell elongation regulator Jag/EloR [Terrisporobacter sp.]MCI5629384.1 protein jag [Clostridium sp.]MDD5879809.1 protein jag [Clostridiales bacterium]MCI6458913.1 protein jag [Clostridium sp.]MCI7205352.1 protein jag [Clostridium sp.]MDD7755383.1 protein jag [Clostridiales bacterium]